MSIPRMTVEEAFHRMNEGEKIFFVDARNEMAWGESRDELPGALRVDLEHPADAANQFPGDATLIVYCTCPHDENSILVAEAIRGRNRTDVHVLQGGYQAWVDRGYPTENKVVRSYSDQRRGEFVLTWSLGR